MAQQFWVVGGEYADTSFTEIVGGASEQRLGPFDAYDEAKAVWRAKAMETIDDAHVRYRIEEENSSEYWVVGGVYTGTNFKTIENGGEEERLGPFANYEDAKVAWRAKAMETIDDAHVRYRIENI